MRKRALTCALMLMGCGLTDKAVNIGDDGGGDAGQDTAPPGDDATIDQHAPPSDAASDQVPPGDDAADDSSADAPAGDSPSDDGGGDALLCGMSNDTCDPHSGMNTCCINLGCHGDGKCNSCVSAAPCDGMGNPCCFPNVCAIDHTCQVTCVGDKQPGCPGTPCCVDEYCDGPTSTCHMCKHAGDPCNQGYECCGGMCNTGIHQCK